MCHLGMVGDGRDGHYFNVVDAPVPHESRGPGEVGKSGGVALAHPALYPKAEWDVVVGKAMNLSVAGAA